MAEVNVWQDLSIEVNEIRLLVIEPADKPEQLLVCSLTVLSLDENPQYEAVSYVWGDASNLVSISLNGQTWPVRENLYYGLQNFRLADRSRVMFVDALCIDQDNIPEKSSQVFLMSRIFSQASCVRCWLGLARPDDVHAIELLRLGQVKVLSDRMELIAQITATRRDVKAMKDLFMRPYWERVWIVQEFALASSAVFHCGRHCFEGDLLANVFRLVKSINGDVRQESRQLMHNSKSLFSNTSQENIEKLMDDIKELMEDYKELFDVLTPRIDLLARAKSLIGNGYFLNGNEFGLMLFSTRAATLPHDHVYASLGLLRPDLRRLLVPDYDKSISSVYRTFTVECMKSSHSPDLLYASIGLQPTPHKLSSWVPDYSQKYSTLAGFSERFVANTEVGYYFSLNDREMLEIRGCYLDEIVAHYPCDKQGRMDWDAQTEQEYHRRWRKFFQLPEIPETAVVSAESTAAGTLEDAYWHTLARSHCVNPETSERCWLDTGTVSACKLWLRASLEGSDLKISAEMQERIDRYHRSIEVMDDTHLFRTRNGYFGVTDRSTSLELGDHVFIIAGMACPCVLRPSDRSTKEVVYKFVTSSYVHGAMLRRVGKEHISEPSVCPEPMDSSHPQAAPEDKWYRILID